MKVIRVLMFEGPEEWIKPMLDRSWLKPDHSPPILGTGRAARELARITNPAAVEAFIKLAALEEVKQ